MCFPRDRVHHGGFPYAAVAIGIVNGIFYAVELPLPGMFPEEQFLLVGMVHFDGTDPDAPEGMSFEQVVNAGTGFLHAFMVDVPV